MNEIALQVTARLEDHKNPLRSLLVEVPCLYK